MTKKTVKPAQSKDIAIGERIKVQNLSKPIKDFLEEKITSNSLRFLLNSPRTPISKSLF